MTTDVIAKALGLLDSGGTQTEYSSLSAVRDDYERQLAAIQNNDMVPEKAKHRMTADLKTKFREAWHKARKAVEAKDQAQLKEAWKGWNPVPNVAQLSPGEVQARREVLEEIEALKDNPEGILDLYARYHAMGYDIGMDAVAQGGRHYLNAEQAKELQALEDHRRPGQAEARQKWEDLKAKQDADNQGRALQETNFMAATELSPAESDALAKAQAGLQPVQDSGTMDAQGGN